MSRSTRRLGAVAAVGAAAMAIGGTALAAPGGSTGPSSSDPHTWCATSPG